MSGDRIDGGKLWNPGPMRVFTATELARAGGPGPSRPVTAMSGNNAALLIFVVLQAASARATPRLAALLLAAVVVAGVAARRLWLNPSRRALMGSRLPMRLALRRSACRCVCAWTTRQTAPRLSGCARVPRG